jgi:hypothetical protein
MTGYIGSDPDKAVKNLKDVMTALKYMGDSTVRESMISEKQPVAARFKQLDEVEMPKVQRPGLQKWEKQGLEGYWNTFVRANTQRMLNNAKAHVDDYLKRMVEGTRVTTTRSSPRRGRKRGRRCGRLLRRLRSWTRSGNGTGRKFGVTRFEVFHDLWSDGTNV